MNHVSNAVFPLHAERRDASMVARDGLHDRLQRTTAGADHPGFVCARGLPGAANGQCSDQCKSQCSAPHRMAGMRIAFTGSGGLRSVGELAHRHDAHSRTRFAHIARWIATREIIGFMWQAEPWVPMFQFDAGPRLQPRRALQPLFGLLVPLYDAWEMANWFARPNQWLSGHRPVDDCAGHLSSVLDVAHLEHFIATGKTPWQHPAATRRIGN